jgi:hypothetical protein
LREVPIAAGPAKPSPSQASSFLIDGEAVTARDDGTPDFHMRCGADAVAVRR